MKKRIEEQLMRLKIMGGSLILLAILFSAITYALPDSEINYWLSSQGKEGTYALSAFFTFLGLYCFGAVWRRQNFI